MFNVEVLSKFPVVQHFRFGSLFKWETDPDAPPPATSVHTANQPTKAPFSTSANQKYSMTAPSSSSAHTPAKSTFPNISSSGTSAPWARSSTQRPTALHTTQQTGTARTQRQLSGMNTSQPPPARRVSTDSNASMLPPTRAPWAKPPART